MSRAELFYRLWLADWASTEIAEGYGVGEELVRILVSSVIVRKCDEAGIAI